MLFIALQAGRCIQPDGCCWRSCSGSPLAAPPSPHRPVSPLYAPFRGALGTGRAVLTPCPWLLLGLLVVCVPANDLGAAGAEAIAGVLPDCTFPELDLSRCKLGDAGVTAIATVLPSCPQICRLILEDNQLGAVAGARLADMLPACPHIRELNIQCTLLPAWLRRTDGGSSPQSMRVWLLCRVALCPRREPLGASRRRQLGRVSWPSVQTEDVDDGPYVARQPQRVATAACLTPWCVCVCV